MQAAWDRPTQNVKENLKKKLKSNGGQQRHAKRKRKFKKIKIKSSGGQTHISHYYLQLINFKQRELDPHKMQQKIKNIKIKLAGARPTQHNIICN